MRRLPVLALCALLGAGVPALAGAPGGGRPPPPGPGVRPPPPGGWHGGWHGGWPGSPPRFWGPRVGVVVGAPWGWAGWPVAYPVTWGVAYGWPSFAAVPVVVGPSPVVVTTAPAAAAAVPPAAMATPPAASPAPVYWYYCTQPVGYFPYVQACDQAWLKVVPPVPGDPSALPRLAP